MIKPQGSEKEGIDTKDCRFQTLIYSKLCPEFLYHLNETYIMVLDREKAKHFAALNKI